MKKSHKNLLKILFGSVIVMILSMPFIVILMAIQSEPSVARIEGLSAQEISQVEKLVLENAPRSTYQVTEQRVTLSEEELNLLLRYALATINLTGDWAAEMTLAENAINAEASVGFDIAGVTTFINFSGEFENTGTMLELSRLHLGNFSLPSSAINFLLRRAESSINSSNLALTDVNELLSNVDSLAISSERLQSTLQWDPVLMSRLSDQTQQLFVSDQERMRVAHYYQVIEETIAATPLDIRAISINTLFKPLFLEALTRSNSGADPIHENRALFQALAIYVNQEELNRFFGDEIALRMQKAKFIEVRLQRRQDLAKHVASIASITASAGADVAAMVSTTKEAYDARYRSGFSFSDLTANTVGVNLAVLATKNTESARLLQQRMTQIENESEFMPATGDSRDGLSEADFTALYDNRNSEQYLEKMEEIEALVLTSAVFSDLTAILASP
ncbi:MAG: hypothetical protein AB8B95_13490 [Pseudohongiellaceae bacterium]